MRRHRIVLEEWAAIEDRAATNSPWVGRRKGLLIEAVVAWLRPQSVS